MNRQRPARGRGRPGLAWLACVLALSGCGEPEQAPRSCAQDSHCRDTERCCDNLCRPLALGCDSADASGSDTALGDAAGGAAGGGDTAGQDSVGQDSAGQDSVGSGGAGDAASGGGTGGDAAGGGGDPGDSGADASGPAGPCGRLGVACRAGFTCEPGAAIGDGWCVSDDGASVLVPGGRFWMGCNAASDSQCYSWEEPQHAVEVASFEIDRTEVTAASYKACAGCSAPCTTCEGSAEAGTFDAPARQDHPINFVSWSQARTYCEARGDGWRLCSEAEWEKAARGGCSLYCEAGDDACCRTAMPVYPWGNQAPSCALASSNGCEAEAGKVGSWPAGASPYGV